MPKTPTERVREFRARQRQQQEGQQRQRGGNRQGAGRPRGTRTAADRNREYRQRIKENRERLTNDNGSLGMDIINGKAPSPRKLKHGVIPNSFEWTPEPTFSTEEGINRPQRRSGAQDFIRVNLKNEEHEGNHKKSSSRQNPAAPSNLHKKQKLQSDQNNQDISDSDTNNQTLKTTDQADAFGKYVASKVRQLEQQQRMFVERIIYEAIFAGQMDHLDINSQLIINTETYISGQGDNNITRRTKKEEVDLGKNASQIKDERDTEDTKYLFVEASSYIEGSELSGVLQSHSRHEIIPFKIEVVTDVDVNILRESELPYEDIHIKQEAVTEEDENLLGKSDI